jgi:DNA segregation ATPase FtsK/SpoIIIE-like protein
MGDLLLLGPADPEPIRAQGPLVTDEEIERVIEFWRKESGQTSVEVIDRTSANKESFVSEQEDDIMSDEEFQDKQDVRQLSVNPNEKDFNIDNSSEPLSIEEAQFVDSKSLLRIVKSDRSTTAPKLRNNDERLDERLNEEGATHEFGSSYKNSDCETITQSSSQGQFEKSAKIFKQTINIPKLAEDIYIEGKGAHKVNMGLPPRPKELNMSEDLWSIMYGYSVRLIVRDKRPKREYIQVMLSIKTIVAQMIIQLMEKRQIISPYKGPHAPRKVYVTLEQVDQIYPGDIFSMDNYTELNDQRS